MIKLLRGLGSLIVIGALLVGVPIALVTIAGNPLPSPEQWQAIFTLTPDYGWVITTTKVLPLLCWIAWAAFAGPLLVEIFAGIAGRPTRKRVGVFRGQQRVAASLVAAVAVMLTGFGAIGTTTPAAAADFSQSVSVSTVATAPAQSSPAPSIATTTPETAAPIAAESPAPAFVYTTVSHAVVRGDTLWDLAENYYGDGRRYPEIFEANRGVVQSDGRALSDPDLIITGWTLAVPNVQVEQAPPSPAPELPPSGTDDSTSSDSLDEGTDTGADAGGAGADSAGGAGGAGAGAGAGAGSQSDSSASDTSASTEEASTSNTDVNEADDAESLIPLATAGGAVGLLLAGLLAAIGTRRLRQRRQRAAGERIAMPEQAAADLELEMRLVENPIGVEDIDNALRGLQEWAENTGSVLPELLAVRLADDEIAVYLTQPADLPEPFEPAHPDRTAWVVRPGRATPPTRPTVSPYPALTTIGTDDAGGVLLLDLEQIGSLNVVGDAETARGVLTAIAVELAVNPWSDQIQVTLVGMPHGLAHEIGTFRIQHVDDVPALLRNLRADMDDRRAALDSYGVDDVHQARVRATEMESWAPHIVILGEEPAEHLRAELAELVARMPRLGIATVASGDAIAAGSTVVITDRTTAEYRSGGQLPPLPFHPQILAGEELELIQNLFDTTTRESIPADLPIENHIDERPPLEEQTAAPEATETAGELAEETETPVAEIPTVNTPAEEVAVGSVDETAVEPDLSSEEPASGSASSDVDDAASLPEPDAATAVDSTSSVSVEPATEGLDPAATVQAPEWPAPYVRLLGTIDVLNVADADSLPGRGVEMMAYLLLHNGQVPGAQLQKAFWPDKYEPSNNNARQLAKHLRNALGSDPEGHKLLPEGRNDVGFRIHPAIRSDWDDFRELIGPDLKVTPNEDLIAAIRLVRGQPLTPARNRRGWWVWRSLLEEQMIAAVLDAADELAHRALRHGEIDQARFAARIAQSADPLNEAGWRLELEAAMRAGSATEFSRVVDELYARPGGGDPDYELDEATQRLIDAAQTKLAGTR